MKHPNPDMLVYIAMADAYAAAAEYLKFPRDHHVKQEILKFDGYKSHPTHRGKPGSYTDDTEMSAANARTLIKQRIEAISRLDFAEAYVEEFSRGGQRKGYSNSFQSFLERVKTGREFLETIRPDSIKNGAAMRAMPFGVLRDPWHVRSVAQLQASVTHDTPEGLFSAGTVALMTHFALYSDRPLTEIGAYCHEFVGLEDGRSFGHVFRTRWSGGSVKNSDRISVAITTVHAVLDLVMHQSSLMAILKTAIEWGGDTDSVAAIAWGVASARYQDEKLPEFMRRDLEQGSERTGVAYLADLGAKLMKKYS